MEHVARVTNQYHQMQWLKKELKKGEMLVWMDFAETYNCNTMEEIQ